MVDREASDAGAPAGGADPAAAPTEAGGEAGLNLYREATRRAEQMRQLVELGQRLNSTLALEPLLQTIVVEVQGALHCRLVVLGLLEGDRLQPVSVASPEGLLAPAEDVTIDHDQGLCGWVVHHGVAQCIPDTSADPRYYCPPSWQHLGLRSAAVVPVRLGQQVLGVLDAESERPAAFDAL
ncbi:MAG: GAF domain-containing protein, partial [Anaerolineae bacterium]|nr:GAF domain-containing protein [Anaerolineae bacterium]